MTPEQRQRKGQRQSLELARARAEADLQRATVPAHRRMLEEVLKTLDEQLQNLRTQDHR